MSQVMHVSNDFLGGNIMTQHHRKISLLIGLLATLALAVGLLAAPASAATKGAVKGVVTLSGKPLAGATVTLRRTPNGEDFETYKTTTTNTSGAYTFSRRTRTSDFVYSVVVSDSRHRAVTTVREFNNKSNTVTRNVTMRPAGSVTGKITRADGSSPAKTEVLLEELDFESGPPGAPELIYENYSKVNKDGTYRFVGIPAGDYTIQYIDGTYSTYLNQCYNDVVAQRRDALPCAKHGNQIAVKGGANTAIKDQQLNHIGGRFQGTVTDTSSKPLKNITVTPIPVGLKSTDYYFGYSSRSTGRFTAALIEPGRLQLQISDPAGKWASRWYNSTSRSGAKAFTIADGTVFKDLTVKLKSRATISLMSKPGRRRATVTVKVSRKATGGRASGKVTVSLGNISKTVTLKKGSAKVTLTKLPAGKQKLRAQFRGNSSTATAHKTVSTKIR